MNDKLWQIIGEIVEREHKYHTSGYDGVIGATDEDMAKINKLMISKEEVREAIGSKESPSINVKGTNVSAIRNQLRSELLKRLEL